MAHLYYISLLSNKTRATQHGPRNTAPNSPPFFKEEYPKGEVVPFLGVGRLDEAKAEYNQGWSTRAPQTTLLEFVFLDLDFEFWKLEIE